MRSEAFLISAPCSGSTAITRTACGWTGRLDALPRLLTRAVSGSNKFGGRENLDAIDLLRRLNTRSIRRTRTSRPWPKSRPHWGMVSRPDLTSAASVRHEVGHGLDARTLSLHASTSPCTAGTTQRLTFRALSASRRILLLSHERWCTARLAAGQMPGDPLAEVRQPPAALADARHPGKKLLFMGGELVSGRSGTTTASWTGA